MGELYKLTSPSGKSYIGVTMQDADVRFDRHVRHTKDGRQYAIHLAIKKYGREAFLIEVLATSDDYRELLQLERRAIQEHGTMVPNGYNMTGGGEKSDFWRPEALKRIRAGVQARWDSMTAEQRRAATSKQVAAMAAAMADPEREADRRRKISETMKQSALRGSANGASKLGEDDVRAIKLKKGDQSASSLAKEFGVSRRLISAIWCGKRWSHLEEAK